MAEHSHNGHGEKGHGHITDLPDVSYIRNEDVTHEASDVSVEGLLKFVLGLTIMTIATFILMWALFKLLNRQAEQRNQDAPQGPMARTQEERLPPEPRLQQAPGFEVKLEDGKVVNLDTENSPAQPQAEFRVLREQWDRVLQTGKPNDLTTSSGLPIDQAIKKLIETNAIKSTPNAPKWDELTGDMPTAASSGRTIQKARQ